MAITKQTPNTVHLGGPVTYVNTVQAGEAITPGHLIELYDHGSGIGRYRKHTLTSKEGNTYAADASMLNKAVDTDYADEDLVEAIVCAPGASVWALIASGQNIAIGNALESAGNGTLKVYASGVKIATALESVNATALTRIRVEVL